MTEKEKLINKIFEITQDWNLCSGLASESYKDIIEYYDNLIK